MNWTISIFGTVLARAPWPSFGPRVADSAIPYHPVGSTFDRMSPDRAVADRPCRSAT